MKLEAAVKGVLLNTGPQQRGRAIARKVVEGRLNEGHTRTV